MIDGKVYEITNTDDIGSGIRSGYIFAPFAVGMVLYPLLVLVTDDVPIGDREMGVCELIPLCPHLAGGYAVSA